ncbi:MAG TPA: hypothetical protein VN695_01585 [Streptosporangiaceae bacterium]|nr:hypothetical protein [Streptosporangiaceae bacterium]
MTDAPASAGRRAAAGYLRELLAQQGRYRRRWEQHMLRSRPGEITQLAVAEVLARYLWSHPRVSGDEDVIARQLKDTVARALSGSVLSRPTLALFIEAFGISDAHADRLWRLWEGSGKISVLTGERAVGVKTETELRSALGPRRHETVSLHDHVDVGSDGRLAQARTLAVIEAITDGLDRIPYLYDTNSLTLEVGQGCGEITGELYQVSDGVYATTIPLAKELSAGETISLEYLTTYRYPGNLNDPHEREFRRAVMRRLENLDMRVAFHPDMLPARIWWAAWDGLNGDIIEREQVPLGTQHEVHRYLRAVERTVVGFAWSWKVED